MKNQPVFIIIGLVILTVVVYLFYSKMFASTNTVVNNKTILTTPTTSSVSNNSAVQASVSNTVAPIISTPAVIATASTPVADSTKLFDANIYMQSNSDIAAAVNNGSFTSPLDHYKQWGKYEGRIASVYQLNQNGGKPYPDPHGSALAYVAAHGGYGPPDMSSHKYYGGIGGSVLSTVITVAPYVVAAL